MDGHREPDQSGVAIMLDRGCFVAAEPLLAMTSQSGARRGGLPQAGFPIPKAWNPIFRRAARSTMLRPSNSEAGLGMPAKIRA